ncbi:MAG: hypothetical protein E6J34_09575 [Chloroflexi bacterium]|nr:MAG: hypothetical protein E6J34_09575 [Chloroflexota bacterium]
MHWFLHQSKLESCLFRSCPAHLWWYFLIQQAAAPIFSISNAWDQPRLQTPEQFERWSHIVAIAHNHLVLASPLVEPELRPWESKQRSALRGGKRVPLCSLFLGLLKQEYP